MTDSVDPITEKLKPLDYFVKALVVYFVYFLLWDVLVILKVEIKVEIS